MSIVSSIRDYVEFLNNLSESFGSDLNLTKFITESSLYFLKTLQTSIYYLITFQWLRDFTLLPISIPQISEAIFKENLFLEIKDARKVFFQFLEIPSLNQNKFILGFFNSFFLTLPVTLTHIISFRRLLIQGIPAAFFSFLGFIVGQTLFILCIIFGIRGILIPWLTLEPFNYILGFILIFQVIYNMVGENLIPLSWNNQSHRKLFRNFFLVNLILSWCEQSSIFQYLSNITVSEYPSILEGFSTKTNLSNFLSHSNYLFGILLGSIVFSIFWGFIVLQIKNLVVTFTRISLAGFLQTINKATFIVVIGFTLSSIPFYGFDYLFTGPLGFISGDSALKNTILTQDRIKDPYSLIFNPEDPNVPFDTAPFDRGKFLVLPESYTFEDLNYRGELDWHLRFEKESTISSFKSNFFNNLFKKSSSDKKSTTNALLEETTNKTYEYNKVLSQDTENKIMIEDPEIQNRFRNWYNLNALEGDDDTLFKTNFQNFSQNTQPVEFLYPQKNTPNIGLERKIKNKYYSNPIYKNLLALDIDLFLNRQQKSSFLTKQNEIDLYQKREILNSYFNSVRDYSKLPYYEDFETFFDGSKSYINKIYNQQFKGTLEPLRRLFCLEIKSGNEDKIKNEFDYTLKDLQENTLSSPLKYDQPLYQNKDTFSPYHEELPVIVDKLKEVQRFTLQDMISKPLYAGWDATLRKFVITNKLIPQKDAGYKIHIDEKWSNQFQRDTNASSTQKLQKIRFSAWPKTESDILSSKESFVTLYEKNPDNKEIINDLNQYTSLPSNYKVVQFVLRSSENITKDSKKESPLLNLMPKRGGFVWPGNLGFDFKQIVK